MLKKILILILSVCILSLAIVSVFAVNNGFIINKTDENGKPINAVEFDVYGKPKVTWVLEPVQPTTTEIKFIMEYNYRWLYYVEKATQKLNIHCVSNPNVSSELLEFKDTDDNHTITKSVNLKTNELYKVVQEDIEKSDIYSERSQPYWASFSDKDNIMIPDEFYIYVNEDGSCDLRIYDNNNNFSNVSEIKKHKHYSFFREENYLDPYSYYSPMYYSAKDVTMSILDEPVLIAGAFGLKKSILSKVNDNEIKMLNCCYNDYSDLTY